MAQRSTAWAAAGLGALLCAGIGGLAFASGGYFPGPTGIAEAVAAVALASWFVLARAPLAGLSRPLVLAVAALGAFALWTILSAHWSHAPTRALVEADRALLYTLAVALAGLIGSVASVRRWAQTGLVAVLALIAVSGLVTRLLPGLWSVPDGMQLDRLSYPVGYWNALGAISALAAIGGLALAADGGRHRVVRAAAAATVPLACATLVLTFSRGAIGVGLVGAVAVLALARTPGTAAALVATVPATALTAGLVLRSDAVVHASRHPSPWVAVAVAALAAAAAALQWRLDGWRPALPKPRPRVTRTIGAAALVVAITGAIATGAAGAVIDRAGEFTRSSHVVETGDERSRLTQLSDNGRIDGWRVSLDALAEQPLHGTGAGTFALTWVRDRPGIQEITDGHSLLFESLGELGVVGTALLVLAIGALAWGAARGLRTPARTASALGLVVLLTWALHASLDWDWEMPALTLPALAMAALVSGNVREPATRRTPGWPVRAIAVAAICALGLVGVGVALSQRHVDTALAAVRDNRCSEAVSAARAALRVDAQRPEPHQVLAVCAVQQGDPEGALLEMRRALALDPNNWRLVYDIAVLRATAGLDPRPTMRQARRLNPNSWLLRIASRELRGDGPAAWRAAGAKANLLL